MMVPKTTAETLKHKINPSLELAAPQAVDVLLYTPGRRTQKHAATVSDVIVSGFSFILWEILSSQVSAVTPTHTS